MSDTANRLLAMMWLIPEEPAMATTGMIHQRLGNQGFATSKRTVERDLERMRLAYGFECRSEGKTLLWCFPVGQKAARLPARDPAAALVMLLARDHLSSVLPSETRELLSGHFAAAERTLGDAPGGESGRRWRRKVRVIQRGPLLQTPRVDRAAQHALYEALHAGRQIQAMYRRRSSAGASAVTLNPLGLVMKEQIVYLVATDTLSDTVKQYAVHRFESATISDTAAQAPEGFDLDHYIDEDQAFSYPASTARWPLVLRIRDHIAVILAERPLAQDQRIEPVGDHWLELTATVADTDELRWWLLSLGEHVEVVAPEPLRQRIRHSLSEALARY